MPNGSIDWKRIKEVDQGGGSPDKHMEELHAYPDSMVGQKLWPNLHLMVSDGTVCAYCQSPFGPEGCYQVGSCGGQFHPQRLIHNMIRRWHCPHCRSLYHPRLYLQFGLWDYMPTHLVYNPDDFPFMNLTARTSNGVGSTTALRSNCGARMRMEIGQEMQLK